MTSGSTTDPALGPVAPGAVGSASAELDPDGFDEAAGLLGRFCLLDDAEAERLGLLIARCGSLSALVRAGTAFPPGALGAEAYRLLWALRTLLELYAYLPEVAEILRCSPEQVGCALDDISDRAYSTQLDAAESQLAQLLTGIADAVLAWPDATGPLLAAGVLQLWGDNPLWVTVCGR
jgi:hypothetical protein